MSIRDRETNKQYSDFLRYTEEAPEGVGCKAKLIAGMIGAFADTLLENARDQGVAVCNADGIRNIEVAIYKEIRTTEQITCNSAESEGSALGDPELRESVMVNMIRDRDFLTEITNAG